MHNLIIIGNGFDLAHGLKTGYKHFLEHIIEAKLKDTTLFEDLYTVGSFHTVSKIKELINRHPSHVTLNNAFFRDIVTQTGKENWCDIEDLYFAQLRANDREDGIRTLNQQFHAIKQHLETYLKAEQAHMQPLESYKTFFDQLKRLEKTVFLNFNYTSTLHQYDVIHDNAKVIHIHGELKAAHNPMIFGFAADDKESRELIGKNDKEYMRNIKKHNYKRTSNEELLVKYLDTTKDIDVTILGHSCGISDKLILHQIFNHPNIKSIRAFYHQDHEHYFETQVNIDRIMNNDDCFKKLINFSNSHRMPQAGDALKQQNDFKTYVRNLTEKQFRKQQKNKTKYEAIIV